MQNVAARPIPLDIKPAWLNVTRRLQSVANSHHGLAVISISVLVDADGQPVQWTEPRRTLLEPKAAKEQLLALLTEGGALT